MLDFEEIITNESEANYDCEAQSLDQISRRKQILQSLEQKRLAKELADLEI